MIAIRDWIVESEQAPIVRPVGSHRHYDVSRSGLTCRPFTANFLELQPIASLGVSVDAEAKQVADLELLFDSPLHGLRKADAWRPSLGINPNARFPPTILFFKADRIASLLPRVVHELRLRFPKRLRQDGTAVLEETGHYTPNVRVLLPVLGRVRHVPLGTKVLRHLYRELSLPRA